MHSDLLFGAMYKFSCLLATVNQNLCIHSVYEYASAHISRKY